MTSNSFIRLFWREFDTIKAGAEFFHVNVATIRRWLKSNSVINPMAEKLLIVKALGYLPNDIRWKGFRINETLGIFITPDGRTFSPHELEQFAVWRDEHRQLVELHGHIERPNIYPAKENVLPFRGGRRANEAQWIPSKQNNGASAWRFNKK
jgi:hypothetical protein